MNAEIKTKWLAALRSGEYKQGNAHLRVNDKYCCLGVLADINGAEWRIRDEVWYVGIVDTNYYYESGTGLSHYQATTLANLNDEGKSFLEIADEIEKTL